MSRLTDYDARYWGIPVEIIEYLESIIPKDAKVLDIGPGPMVGNLEGFYRGPFRRADLFVDCSDVKSIPQDKLIRCNVVEEPLPFPDKHFDFIYCRHVIEDLYNPFPLLTEMQRVGKAGYIETPSPMAELARGAEGNVAHRGYHHHHLFCWMAGNTLRLLWKYPIIEHAIVQEETILQLLRRGPQYWNTYCLWQDKIEWQNRQIVKDFHFSRDYCPMLDKALIDSKEATDKFWALLPQAQIPQLQQIGTVKAA